MNIPTWTRLLGTGQVTVAGDGAPLEFRHSELPAHRFLLQETSDAWHSEEHRWGTGFVITWSIEPHLARCAKFPTIADFMRERGAAYHRAGALAVAC